MGENIKGVMKNAIKSSLRRILPIIMIVVLVLVTLAAMDYAITLDDGIYKEGDMSSTPYAASTYTNSITVEKDGTLKSEKTAQELWDEMIKNGSRVNKYLSNPKELARLMKAEIVTQYPDTRKDPDKEIDWKEIKKNEDLLQGIVKFKRASDGQTAQNATTMSYVDPATFQGYIDDYNATGSQEAKENALKHFTLRKTSTSSVKTSGGLGAFEKYTDLTEDQLKALATVALHEQGSGNGAGNAAELSLMANLYERDKDTNGGYSSVYDYVKRSTWFNDAASYMDTFDSQNNNGTVDSNPEVLEYAKKVLVQGKRTIPGYVDEHDSVGDIGSVTNDGVSINNIKDPSQYIQYKSIIHQNENIRGAGDWIYYCHPTPKSDPFGYTSEERRAQIGELYYEFGTWKEVNGNGNSSNNSDSSNKNNSSTENNTASVKDEKTDVSQAILDAINKTPCPGAGLCLKWVDDVYENAGLSPQRLNSAYDSYKANGISTDRNNIPIGAAVYGTGTGSNGPYGHVGIYIGDGKVVDNVGSIKTQTLDEWISWQENYAKKSNNVMTDINGESQHGWLGWGWADGNKSRGTSGDTGSSSETTSRSSGKGYAAVIATWSQTDTSLTSNDPNVSGYSSTVYSMTTTTVNYQSMVEKYTMPFDFLWALLVVGEEKDFVFELADLVFESDIQVTIYDNLTVNTNVDNWHYDQQHKTQADIYITATSMGESASRNEKNHEHESLTPYRTTKTVITQNNTVNAILTRANTWIVDYKNEYTYNQPTTTSSQNTVTQDDQQYPGTPESTGTTFSCELTEQYKQEATAEVQEKVNANYKDFIGPRDFSLYEVYNVRYYSRYINIADDITSTTETRTYTEGTPEVREKTDKDLDENGEPKELNFVTIFRKGKHITARKNIMSVPEWLFEIVETNGKPDLDLVKYLLYKATGKNYGVTEYDFEQYDASKFKDANSGIAGGTIQEKVWFALKDLGYSDIAAAGAMGNFDYESGGFNPSAIEGGSGEGIGICQWSFGRKTQLMAYAKSKGKDWKDEDTQVEFLIAELSGTGPASGYANRQFMSNKGYTESSFKNAKSVEEATKAFCWIFERPNASAGNSSMSERISRAQKYYKECPTWERSSGSGEILDVCEEVMNDMIKRNVHYSLTNLTSGNIKAASQHPYACCATYVSIVLYKSGLLTESQINAYNYNYTGDGGIPDMLRAAGWKQVPHSEIQPGDVINDYTVHVLIYAGGNKVYDQTCGVVSSSGKPPKGGPYDYWSHYKGNSNVQVWRAPNK